MFMAGLQRRGIYGSLSFYQSLAWSSEYSPVICRFWTWFWLKNRTLLNLIKVLPLEMSMWPEIAKFQCLNSECNCIRSYKRRSNYVSNFCNVVAELAKACFAFDQGLKHRCQFWFTDRTKVQEKWNFLKTLLYTFGVCLEPWKSEGKEKKKWRKFFYCVWKPFLGRKKTQLLTWETC